MTLSLFAPRPTEYAADLFDLLEDTMTTEPTPAPVVETTAPAAPVTPATHGHVTYVATLADGTVSARSTKSMAYTHAVQVSWADGSVGVWSWHKTPAAAVQTANRLVSDRHAVVVPVIGYTYSSAEAKAARAASK